MTLPFRETLKSMMPKAGLEALSTARTAMRRRKALGELRQDHQSPEAKGKFVTYLVMQGMTNRLKAHVAAAHFARSTGRTLVPVWRKTPECWATLRDVFDVREMSWQFGNMRTVTYNVEADRASMELDALKQEQADLIVLDLDWQYIRMENLLDRIGGQEGFQALFDDTLPVRPDILSRVDRTVAEWGRPMVGVQLRRGDFVQFRQAVSVEAYISAAEAALGLHPQAGVFLSSDATRDELEPFLTHFGAKVHFQESRGRAEEEGIRDAMYDLLLLSRCVHLVLTPKSGFGHMAAQIGGVPHEWVTEQI